MAAKPRFRFVPAGDGEKLLLPGRSSNEVGGAARGAIRGLAKSWPLLRGRGFRHDDVDPLARGVTLQARGDNKKSVGPGVSGEAVGRRKSERLGARSAADDRHPFAHADRRSDLARQREAPKRIGPIERTAGKAAQQSPGEKLVGRQSGQRISGQQQQGRAAKPAEARRTAGGQAPSRGGRADPRAVSDRSRVVVVLAPTAAADDENEVGRGDGGERLRPIAAMRRAVRDAAVSLDEGDSATPSASIAGGLAPARTSAHRGGAGRSVESRRARRRARSAAPPIAGPPESRCRRAAPRRRCARGRPRATAAQSPTTAPGLADVQRRHRVSAGRRRFAGAADACASRRHRRAFGNEGERERIVAVGAQRQIGLHPVAVDQGEVAIRPIPGKGERRGQDAAESLMERNRLGARRVRTGVEPRPGVSASDSRSAKDVCVVIDGPETRPARPRPERNEAR